VQLSIEINLLKIGFDCCSAFQHAASAASYLSSAENSLRAAYALAVYFRSLVLRFRGLTALPDASTIRDPDFFGELSTLTYGEESTQRTVEQLLRITEKEYRQLQENFRRRPALECDRDGADSLRDPAISVLF
jgi:hypothetical protein